MSNAVQLLIMKLWMVTSCDDHPRQMGEAEGAVVLLSIEEDSLWLHRLHTRGRRRMLMSTEHPERQTETEMNKLATLSLYSRTFGLIGRRVSRTDTTRGVVQGRLARWSISRPFLAIALNDQPISCVSLRGKRYPLLDFHFLNKEMKTRS